MTATRIPQAILVATFALALLVYSTWSVHHDVAWLMYCGQHMLQGAQLYVDDCIEVNPPISFYLTLLPAYAAMRFDLAPNLCLAVYVLALMAFAIALSMRIYNGANRTENWWIAASLAIALLFTPINNFGQREHFAVILVLPYLFCCNARMSGQPVSRAMALVAGLMAGIGFSIKHYFVLVPLVIEITLAVKRRSLKSLNRIEVYGAVLAALAHAALAVAAHPEYFTQIAPMAMLAYNGYAVGYFDLLTQAWFIVTVFALGYHLRIRKMAAQSSVANVLAIASAAFLAIYVIQDRGWQYHTLPAQILILASSLMIIAKTFCTGDFNWRRIARAKRPLIGIAAAALVVQGVMVGPYSNIMPAVIQPFVEKYAPNRTYYVLSPSISTGFPLPLEKKIIWGSRFPFQWLVPGIIKGQRDNCGGDVARCAKLTEIRDYVLRGLTEDFERYQPGVVFVDRKSLDDPGDLYDDTSFDLLGYFVHGSPEFAKIWAQYEEVDQITFITNPLRTKRVFEIWVRRSDASAAPVQSSLDAAAPTSLKATP